MAQPGGRRPGHPGPLGKLALAASTVTATAGFDSRLGDGPSLSDALQGAGDFQRRLVAGGTFPGPGAGPGQFRPADPGRPVYQPGHERHCPVFCQPTSLRRQLRHVRGRLCGFDPGFPERHIPRGRHPGSPSPLGARAADGADLLDWDGLRCFHIGRRGFLVDAPGAKRLHQAGPGEYSSLHGQHHQRGAAAAGDRAWRRLRDTRGDHRRAERCSCLGRRRSTT